MRNILACLALIACTGCAHYGAPRAGECGTPGPNELLTCWTLPTTNTDGSAVRASCEDSYPCGRLTETKVEYGTCAGSSWGSELGESVVAAPGTAHAFVSVPAGTYCAQAYAFNDFGKSSIVSPVMQYVVGAAPPPEVTPSPPTMQGGSTPSPPDPNPPSGDGEAVLTWTAPLTNTDGTALDPATLAGYNVAWYCSPPFATETTVEIGNVLTYTVADLPTCSFSARVAARTSAGVVGMFSNSATKEVTAPPARRTPPERRGKY